MRKFFGVKILWLICFSLFLSCAGASRKEPESPINNSAKLSRKERIAVLNDSVFCISILVKGKNFEARYSVGTGFLIGEGLMASALHVQSKVGDLAKKFEKASYQTVGWKKFKTGEFVQFSLQIAASDKDGDLAIYRFDDKVLRENPKFAAIKPLALAENLPPLGEEVVSVGYYGDYDFPFNSLGNVAMIDKNEDIFSDLTLMPGNSGAPVCDLETGEVLGVTTDVLDLGNETVRYGIAKRAAKLKELLTKL